MESFSGGQLCDGAGIRVALADAGYRVQMFADDIQVDSGEHKAFSLASLMSILHSSCFRAETEDHYTVSTNSSSSTRNARIVCVLE